MRESERIVAAEVDAASLRTAYSVLFSAPQVALAGFAELANRGSVMSLAYLGWMCQQGLGTPVDLKRAEEYYLQAVARGSTYAAFALGSLYGKEKKFLAAEKMLEKSDIEHEPRAMYRLGGTYIRNAAIRPDIASPGRLRKGMMLLQQAFDAGHPDAGMLLGRTLAFGKAGITQIPRGIRLYWKAVVLSARLDIREPTNENLLDSPFTTKTKVHRAALKAARESNVPRSPSDTPAMSLAADGVLAKVQGPLKVLFIGNSQTSYNDLPLVFQSLLEAASPGCRLEVSRVTVDGASLEYHWNLGTTVAAIRKNSWHYVVLQEQTWRPIRDQAKTAFYLSLFDAVIREGGARTVLYAMWLPGQPPAEQTKISQIYAKLAEGRDVILAPIATAVALSLQRRPDFRLDDGYHPTVAGTYLGAAVLARLFTGASSRFMPHPQLFASGIAGRSLCDIAFDDAAYLTDIVQSSIA